MSGIILRRILVCLWLLVRRQERHEGIAGINAASAHVTNPRRQDFSLFLSQTYKLSLFLLYFCEYFYYIFSLGYKINKFL